MQRLLIIGICASFSLALSGCGGGSGFTYSESMQAPLQSLEAEDYQSAQAILPPVQGPSDQRLHNLELGRIQQLAGNYAASQQRFAAVIADIQGQLNDPKAYWQQILANPTAQQIGLNAYMLQAYELGYLYTYQALNALALKQPAEAEQVLLQGVQAQSKNAANWTTWQNDIAAQTARQTVQISADSYPIYTAMQSNAGKLDPDTNALNLYLAGLLSAANGRAGAATAFFKQASALAPENKVLQAGAQSLGRDSGRLIVVYEQGQAPGVAIAPITIQAGGMSWTEYLPYYDPSTFTAAVPLTVSLPQHNLTTAVLLDNARLAELSLLQEYPLMILLTDRDVVSNAGLNADVQLAASNQDANHLQSYDNDMADVDSRSWLTLPANLQLAAQILTPGTYPLRLNKGSVEQAASIIIRPGHTTLLWVIDLGSSFDINTFNL